MKKTNKTFIFPFIRQSTLQDGVICCLAMIFKYHGLKDLRRLLTQLASSETQASNQYLINKLGDLFGFKTSQYQMKYEGLAQIQTPFVAHKEGSQYCVVYEYDQNSVKIADPTSGKQSLSRQKFEELWSGTVFTLEPEENLSAEKEKDFNTLIENFEAKKKDLFKHYYLSIFLSLRSFFAEILGTSLMLELFNLMLPILSQIILDKVLVHQNQKLLFIILAVMFGVLIGQLALNFARSRFLAQFKVRFELAFYSRFFEHFIHLRQQYFDSHKREDLISVFKENMKIRQAFAPPVLQTLMELLFLFFYFFVLFLYSWKLALLGLFYVFFYAISIMNFSPKVIQLSRAMYEESSRSLGNFLDILVGIQNVKLLGIEHKLNWKWQAQHKKNLNKLLLYEEVQTNMISLLRGIHFSGTASVYWVGAYFTFNGEITVGEYMAFASIFMMIMGTVGKTPVIWTTLVDVYVAFRRINDVLAQQTDEHKIQGKIFEISKPNLSIKNLSFSYAQTQPKSYILHNLNLEIPYGSFVGVVGRNGCGKTTLVKIIAKLYTEYEGNISLNEVSINDLQTHFYRQKVFVIPQQVHIFNDTIKNNILYSNPEASMEDVVRAAKLADLDEFIAKNPLGYHLQIGEGAVKLSGGQQLKIAFARLFLANPEIIILDEASSALDVETERKIMENLLTFFKGKTIISIAHRLHTLRNADFLIVLDKGQVVQQGKHDVLINEEGIYSQFIKTYVNF
ncbi:MAG: peptidase domain-containing ABC transporter [Bacteroidetes bacterium]|nr:MAG: peptidase domain-containing ABC transporter [Bacteroidota bacterium]